MAFTKVLIANRGEIAVRVIRSCRERQIATVAVYSDADRFAMHAQLADEAIGIGPPPAAVSYLDGAAIIRAALTTGAQAIHPGYGFLAENAEFAQACADAGLVFIGPPPAAIRLMGSKTAAKAAVAARAVPTVPGYAGTQQSVKVMLREAERIGYPVMIKAAAGGGGKGMRVVARASQFADALAAAQREAEAAFGDAQVFLEKLVVRPRHIEFQIIADAFGHCVHLGERECSIQRRHQKVVEEAPSLALDAELRASMGAAAVNAALAADYVNAGTIEFLLDQSGKFYFLEMNTRLQVEHPVTEQVTGLDIVTLQLDIAAGKPLPLRQQDIAARGHAIEVRLYAEDSTTYLPATGTLLAFEPPAGPGIRVDGGVVTGTEVTMHYDPMLAKLIVTAPDRPAAIARLRQALADSGILGVTTNLQLLRRIVADERFAAAATFTDFLDDPRYAADFTPPDAATTRLLLVAAATHERDATSAPGTSRQSPWAAGALRAGTFSAHYMVEARNHLVELRDAATAPGSFTATVDGQPFALPELDATVPLQTARATGVARMLVRQGTAQRRLWAATRPDDRSILVSDGEHVLVCAHPLPPDVDRAALGGAVTAGAKRITAPMAGTIVQVRVAEGDLVQPRQTLVILGAMKMEHNIVAPGAARVRRVLAQPGAVVTGGAVLVELSPPES